jgi:hypothetical protein
MAQVSVVDSVSEPAEYKSATTPFKDLSAKYDHGLKLLKLCTVTWILVIVLTTHYFVIGNRKLNSFEFVPVLTH